MNEVAIILDVVEILKSLSDPTRYHIVSLLLTYDYCVGKLAEIVGISESAVSQHLKILREAGVVQKVKRGYFMHYQVDRTLLQELAQQMVRLSETISIESECQARRKYECSCCRSGAVNQLE